VSELADEQD